MADSDCSSRGLFCPGRGLGGMPGRDYNVKAKDEFEFEQWQDKKGSCCKKCKSEEGVKRRKTTREQQKKQQE